MPSLGSTGDGHGDDHASRRLPNPMLDSTSPPPVQAPAEPSLESERNAPRTTDEAPEDNSLRSQQLHDVTEVTAAQLTQNLDGNVSDNTPAADDEKENGKDIMPNTAGSVSDIMAAADEEDDNNVVVPNTAGSASDIMAATDEEEDDNNVVVPNTNSSASDTVVAADEEENNNDDVVSGTDGSVSDTVPAADQEEDNDNDVVPNLSMYMRHELYICRGPLPPFPSAPAGLAEEAAAVAAVAAVDALLVGATEEVVEPESPVENGYATRRL